MPEIDRRQTPTTAITEDQEEPTIAAAIDAVPGFGLKAAEADSPRSLRRRLRLAQYRQTTPH